MMTETAASGFHTRSIALPLPILVLLSFQLFCERVLGEPLSRRKSFDQLQDADRSAKSARHNKRHSAKLLHLPEYELQTIVPPFWNFSGCPAD